MPYGIAQYYLPPGRGDIPALTPAEAGTRLSDPGGMQGWVDLVGWLHTGAAGSLWLYGVRPSVCPSHSPAAAVCGREITARPAPQQHMWAATRLLRTQEADHRLVCTLLYQMNYLWSCWNRTIHTLSLLTITSRAFMLLVISAASIVVN